MKLPPKKPAPLRVIRSVDYSFQDDLLDKALDIIGKWGYCYCNMATGTGKTRFGCRLVRALAPDEQAPEFMFLCPKRDINENNLNTVLEEFFDLSPVEAKKVADDIQRGLPAGM
jgi:superfamily II DNA or RNA helicase